MDLKYLTKEGSWEKNPPDLQAEVLQGKRGRLLVTIYRAGGAGLHPTVLLSHGFPGIEKNFDLAQALRRIGFHVVLYHYSGSWGSDGAYVYAHNLEDADTLLEFIETNTTYGFDRERLFVAGQCRRLCDGTAFGGASGAEGGGSACALRFRRRDGLCG